MKVGSLHYVYITQTFLCQGSKQHKVEKKNNKISKISKVSVSCERYSCSAVFAVIFCERKRKSSLLAVKHFQRKLVNAKFYRPESTGIHETSSRTQITLRLNRAWSEKGTISINKNLKRNDTFRSFVLPFMYFSWVRNVFELLQAGRNKNTELSF
jgi:hypothetical protein